MKAKLLKHQDGVWIPTGRHCVNNSIGVHCEWYDCEWGRCDRFGREPALEDYDNPLSSNVIRLDECIDLFGETK